MPTTAPTVPPKSVDSTQPFSQNEERILATRSGSREMKRNCLKFVELLGECHRTILRPMSRIANALAVLGLAVALAGLSACEPVQNPNGTGVTKTSSLG